MFWTCFYLCVYGSNICHLLNVESNWRLPYIYIYVASYMYIYAFRKSFGQNETATINKLVYNHDNLFAIWKRLSLSFVGVQFRIETFAISFKEDFYVAMGASGLYASQRNQITVTDHYLDNSDGFCIFCEFASR